MRIFKLSRNAVLLIAAITTGLAAAWFARRYIQDHIRALDEQAKVTTVSRIVADYDLPEGLRLESLHLAVMQVPVPWAPSGSVPPEDLGSIEGKVVTTALRKGDILLRANVASARHEAFSQKVRAGRRAITIPVDAINSVSGLLVPGDLIDLYVSFEYRKKKITAPLLQGVLVLATGGESQMNEQADDAAGTGYSTVTLDTSPEEAARLVAARQAGMLTALLRHPQDAQASNKGVQGDLATLLGIARPMAISRQRPAVIYGNQPQQTMPTLAGAATPPLLADHSKGLFELPDSEDIVSVWIKSLPTAEGAPQSTSTQDTR